jgi:DNA-binding NtrC family response regulator
MSDVQPKPGKRYRATVVVVDDEEGMCKILSKILSLEDFHVTGFSRPAEAIEHIRKSPPDLVLTDMKMPELTGMDVLKAARGANPSTNVVVMTAYGTIEGAIDAMRAGAFDYVTKPFKTDELLMTLDKALERTRLIEQNETLTDTLRRQYGESDIVGESPQVREVLAMIAKVAPTDAPVLIRGESGTGKELVARAIHNQSRRPDRRFVAINCASIPESLLESELFGHEKGAFTGADRTKMGLLEVAHEGTLFLDEIGDLSLGLQSKLLRVLQEREIQRVGGLQTIAVDIRLLAATNCDLKAAMEAKEFRQDLFFRLNVISLQLPPLREREGDVPVLVRFFLGKTARKLRKPTPSIAPDALRALERYSYPGNVRELENVIERMVVLCEGDRIALCDVPADIREPGTSRGEPGTAGVPFAAGIEYRDAKDEFERAYLAHIFEAAKGNISEAARMSGISRRHLYEKIEKLNIHIDRT